MIAVKNDILAKATHPWTLTLKKMRDEDEAKFAKRIRQERYLSAGSDRERHTQNFFEALTRNVTFPQIDSALEIGPGRYPATPYFLSRRPGIRYLGIGLSQAEIAFAQKQYGSDNAKFMVADFLSLPVKRFDVVFAANLLNHYVGDGYIAAFARRMLEFAPQAIFNVTTAATEDTPFKTEPKIGERCTIAEKELRKVLKGIGHKQTLISEEMFPGTIHTSVDLRGGPC